MRLLRPTDTGVGALIIVAGFALVACAGADPAAPSGPVKRVTVTVGQDTLTPRQSIEVGAVLTDAQGQRLAGRVVRWSSSAPGVVSVDSNLGVAQARSDGRAMITVTSEGVSGQVGLVVRTLARQITIAPPADTLAAGESTTLTAIVIDTAGQRVTGVPIRWTSLTPQTASVVLVPVSAGLVTAGAAGQAIIQASVGGTNGQVSFGVIPAPLLAGNWLLFDSTTFVGGTAFCRDSAVAALSQTGRSFLGDIQGTGYCIDGPNFSAYGAAQLHPLTLGRVRGASISFLQSFCTYTGTFLSPAQDRAAGTADCGYPPQITHWTMVRRDPATVIMDPVTEVAAGATNTCSLTATQHAYCWGYGPTGEGNFPDGIPLPVEVSGSGFSALGVSAHVCLATSGGATRCFGDNALGQLGAGAIPFATTPTGITGGGAFSGVVTGQDHSCGFSPGQPAFCWGRNDAGQLGTGTSIAEAADPVAVAGPAGFSAMAAGEATTCGLDSVGAAWCWGLNDLGQLGDSLPRSFALAPQPVLGARTFIALAGAGRAFCALDAAGAAYCWGDNTAGRLGDGTTVNHAVPAPAAPALRFTGLAMGENFTCGLTAPGAAYCWGGNQDGQLGNSTIVPALAPVPVAGNHLFRRLGAGAAHACAATLTGKLYCWGRNFAGQLGDGTTHSRSQPVLVLRQ